MGQGSPKSPSRRQARGSTGAAANRKLNFNSMRLTALNEDHLARLHPKLQEIMMMNNMLQLLPDDFFDAVPALEYFDASFNALKKIPPSIGNCVRLKQVQLNQNQIGEIPPEIAELSDLTMLDLSANQIKSFIPELANLENLERLDLSSNFLEELPDDIVALTNIQALRVRGNQLTKVSELLSNLSMLEILDLRHNFLESLSPNLLLTALERLQLSYNNLSELPANFANCSSIIELEISNNRLQTLCDVGSFQYLRRLDLENNVLKRLPDSFGSLESLLDLNLNDNQLEELPENIGDLQSLTSLSLRNNKLSTLPASIGQLVHLENLDLANNEIRKLPKELGSLIGLDRLNLDENYFKALPTSFSGLTKLKTFGVGMNSALNDDGIKPGTFAGMISLVELRVFGTSLTQIPSDVCGMTLLERIFMGNNKLTSVPEEFSRLMRLQHLYLSANELTTFPKPILALTNLHGLWLNNNKLKSIPEEIAQLRDLETLDISENKLKKLPSALGQLKYLHELSVARNSIKMLPATIGGCDELVALDASYNPIEQIPRELRNLLALMHVKFAFCNISEIADVAEGEFIGLRWLCLEGNPIKRIPMKLQGVTDLRDEMYLQERKKQELDDDVPIHIVGLPEKKTDLFDIDISEMQGIRPTMEDSILIKEATPLQVDKYTFKLIAVFDGHADSRAAEYCAINFHQFIEDELKRTLTRRMRMIRRESKRRMKNQGIIGGPTGPARIRSESDKGPSTSNGSTEVPLSPEKVSGKKRGQSVLVTSPKPESASPTSSPSKKSKKSKKKGGSASDPTSEVSSAISPSPSSPDLAATSAPDGINADGALTLDLDKVVPQAIHISFDRIRESVFDKEIKSGCTAAMVLLFGNKLWFVSCGDARAVVSIDKVAKRGTRDHKALDADERMRVQKIGGFLAENGRLMGKIAVSRAIGDQEFWPFVTSDPYIHQETLTEKHEFLIVACDGVWDVLSDQRACDIVRNHYQATGSYYGSANVLRDVSYQLGSGDNISVIVVGLKTHA